MPFIDTKKDTIDSLVSQNRRKKDKEIGKQFEDETTQDSTFFSWDQVEDKNYKMYGINWKYYGARLIAALVFIALFVAIFLWASNQVG